MTRRFALLFRAARHPVRHRGRSDRGERSAADWQYSAVLTPLGILKDGEIDAERLAAERKNQMQRSGGALTVPVLGDVFSFHQADVDALMRCIERA